MNAKLTLTIEQEVIKKAKLYAKNKNRSLSDIIENYLDLLTNKNQTEKEETNPLVESLRGAFKDIDTGFDYKEELMKNLEEKHL